MQRSLVSLPLLVLASAACSAAPEAETAVDESALHGTVTYASDCTADHRAFLDKTFSLARVVSGSRAFEQCVEHAVKVGFDTANAKYKQCNGDPYYGYPVNEQVKRALDAARSWNDMTIHCTGGTGNASASLDSYDRVSAEQFAFSTWLDAVTPRGLAPRCTAGQVPDVDNCRNSAWPHSQAAGTIWHEAMHQHGYTHGANEQAPARVACGYSDYPDSVWNFQVNTMPYIIGACIDRVMAESDGDGVNRCGTIDSCGAGQARLVTGIGAEGCECVTEPTAVNTRMPGSFQVNGGTPEGARFYLNNASLNNQPRAIVHLTHVLSRTGTTPMNNGHHARVGFDSVRLRWYIENSDGAAMPASAMYNVRVGRGFQHMVTSSNRLGHMTFLSNNLADRDPEALVTVSRGVTARAHPIGTWYSANHWFIFNQDRVALNDNEVFTVSVETSLHRGLHFTHTATSANTSGTFTILDHPALNGRSGAMFLITPKYASSAVYVRDDVGIAYHSDIQRWAIHTENGSSAGASLPLGAVFDIELNRVERQQFVKVAEDQALVTSGISAFSDNLVSLHGSGTVWAGDFWTGANGPEGQSSLASSGYPAPSAHRYSLLGRLGTGAFFEVGRDAAPAASYTPTTSGVLSFRTNDNSPGGGNGAFAVLVRVY